MGSTSPQRASRRGPLPHGQATLADVARHVGVSAQSVSNALHRPDRVSPELRDRILAAVAELDYRPNRSARTLRSRRSHLIGVTVEPADDQRAALLLDQFLHALAETADAVGCHVILCHTRRGHDEMGAYHELLRTTAVDALVLTNSHHDDHRIRALQDLGVPFATFGRAWDTAADHPWVDVDGRAGLRLAVEHLASLGHERIGHVGWPDDSDAGHDRRSGWRSACSGDPELDVAVDDDFESARAAVHRLLALPSPPTALACSSDTLALGAMRAVAERGLRVGPDVAVTGYDNTPAAALTTPGLTSLRQPLAHVAAELVNGLERMWSEPGGPPLQLLLAPDLVVRDSTATSSPVSAPPTLTKETS